MLRVERLNPAIETLAQKTQLQAQQAESELAGLRRWLDAAPPPAYLRERLTSGTSSQEEVAIPQTDLPLASTLCAENAPMPGSVIIGADGSQITPDRHAVALYYVLQVGALIFRYNGQAPVPIQESELHFAEDELYDENGMLITGQLGMRRTIAELNLLVSAAESVRSAGALSPILTLIDGPLLWPYSGRSKEEETALPRYFAALSRLREIQAMPVGFVERPGGRSLIELLWHSRLDESGQPLNEGEKRPEVVNDEVFMAKILPPGMRTAWLRRPSVMNERHARHGHAIWFCYTNLGEENAPVIARVEAPEWAAQQEDWTAKLHATLHHQARILQGNPYVLARAHELALITHQDKAALESVLRRRLLRHGVIARTSEKARQKGLF